ncbi:hypothetical protein EZV62_008375 [Acer yangbiense]|uniref:Uncharacterized protein n=1 Tax=Acer yangbiense TaxID=1000413 RepID=A0A5C7ICM4_9ROSI|nr:hypothetical protein EZV62_008375 [Acer yangbiense]
MKKATISKAMAPKNKAYVIPTSNLSKPLLSTLKWKIKRAATTEAKDMNRVEYPNREFFMEYDLSLIQSCVDKHLQEALLLSIASSRCSLSPLYLYGQTGQQLQVCSC